MHKKMVVSGQLLILEGYNMTSAAKYGHWIN